MQGAEELLRHADRALYAAKAAGKGCWRVHVAPPVLTPGRAAAESLPTPRTEEQIMTAVARA